MADAHTRIDSLKEDIRELGYTVLDLQARAVVHDSKLEQVLATQLAHDARFDAHDARLDTIDNRLSAIDNRFSTIDNRFSTIDNRLSAIDNRLSAMDTRFDTTDARFDRVDEVLAEVLSRLSQPPR
jgi:chromosome segregation ATPase